MKKVATKLKAYLFAAIILICALLLLETLALFNSYDYSANYFNSSPAVSLIKALIAVSTIAFLSSIIFIPKGELNGTSPMTLAALIPSALIGTIFAAAGVIFLLGGAKVKAVTSLFTGLDNTYSGVLIAGGFLLIVSSMYFFMNFASEKKGVKLPQTILGFVAPLSVTLVVIAGHFDTSVSMNSDAKVMFQVAAVFFMLWFLTELRTLVGKPAPRAYFALGLISSLLSAAASIPFIIAFCAGIINKPIFPTYIIYTALAFAMFIYTFARTAVFVSARAAFERIAPPEIEPELETEKENEEENAEENGEKDEKI